MSNTRLSNNTLQVPQWPSYNTMTTLILTAIKKFNEDNNTQYVNIINNFRL